MTDLLKAHTLLVIPSDDLRGMLHGGMCGFRPPMAWFCSRAQVVPVSCHDPLPEVMTLDAGWHPVPDVYVSAGSKQALVLRWEGQNLPHGWLAVWLRVDWFPWEFSATRKGEALGRLRAKGCTIIAVDEHGREVEHG